MFLNTNVMIQYNQPIEVTKEQFTIIKKIYSGFVAFKEQNGKFYIKVWYMKIASKINQLINQ